MTFKQTLFVNVGLAVLMMGALAYAAINPCREPSTSRK